MSTARMRNLALAGDARLSREGVFLAEARAFRDRYAGVPMDGVQGFICWPLLAGDSNHWNGLPDACGT